MSLFLSPKAEKWNYYFHQEWINRNCFRDEKMGHATISSPRAFFYRRNLSFSLFLVVFSFLSDSTMEQVKYDHVRVRKIIRVLSLSTIDTLTLTKMLSRAARHWLWPLLEMSRVHTERERESTELRDVFFPTLQEISTELFTILEIFKSSHKPSREG